MKVAAVVIGGLVLAAIFFVVVLLVVKLMWAWTLFPGAMAQGLVASEITWLAALKLAIIAAIFGAFAGGASAHRERRGEPAAR